MTCRAQPSHDVQRHADIVAVNNSCLARVDSHTHAEGRPVGPGMRSDFLLCPPRARNCIRGRIEYDEHCVATGAELNPVVRRDRSRMILRCTSSRLP